MQSRANFDLGASGTGGMRPAQRPPSEWSKGPLEIGKEPDQGAMKTSRPTMRGFNPAVSGTGGNYSSSVIDARPGVMAQRALAPIPGELTTIYQMAPGGYVAQELAGAGTFDTLGPEVGDDGNIGGSPQGPFKEAKGSATKTTGRPVTGGTGGKGMI